VPGYTRHQLKEDRVKQTAGEAMHWSAEHRGSLIRGGLLAVAALLAIAGGFWYYQHTGDTANAALGKAVLTLNAPVVASKENIPPGMEVYSSIAERNAAARKELDEVAKSYPHTAAGKSARYLAAAAAMNAGDNKYAEEQLQELSKSGDAETAAMAKFALGSVYRNTNRIGDAEKIYNDLKDHPTTTVPKVRALLELADMYETSQPSQATTIYQQVQKEFPKSVAASIARERLESAKKL
jgi:predicted negative regulator of RcsB-dependent stress response